MRPAAVIGLVGATAAAAAVLGARVERWRTRRALDAAVQIIDRFAQDNLARAARQDAEVAGLYFRRQWIAPHPQAWAAFTEGRDNPEAN